MYWNIEGLHNKLEFEDFKRYIQSYYIIALGETWQLNEIEGVCDSHVVYSLPAEKQSKYGRAMGGMSVYIHRDVSKYITRINTDCKIGICLKMNKLVCGDMDTIIMFAYLPPVNSPFYANKNFKGIELLEHEITLLEGHLPNRNFIIMGDLNSRVGEKVVNCNTNANIPELEQVNDFFRSPISEQRCSQDKVINTFGKDLIELCQVQSLSILNGVVGKDSNTGNYTFLSTNGNSVIDLGICSTKSLHIIDNFEVGLRCESSHMPIIMELKKVFPIYTQNIQKQNNNHEDIRYRISSHDIETYKESLNEIITNSWNSRLSTDIRNDT